MRSPDAVLDMMMGARLPIRGGLQGNAVKMVKGAEEVFKQAAIRGPELVKGFRIFGNKGLVGTTFTRNVFLIDTQNRSVAGLRALVNSLEQEGAGRWRLEIEYRWTRRNQFGPTLYPSSSAVWVHTSADKTVDDRVNQGTHTMNDDPQFVADRLVWRFKKSGGEGLFSKPFGSFPDSVQASVRKTAALDAREVPALLCYQSATRWTLLTNARIVWIDEPRIHSLRLDSVVDATMDSEALLVAGGKGTLSALTVVERGGSRHRLELEPGPPFSGFWNAIKAGVNDKV